MQIEGTVTIIIKYSNYFDRQRHYQLNKSFAIAAVSFVLTLGFFGCGSSKETESLPAEERFADAMTKFIHENYLDAAEDFKTVTSNIRGVHLPTVPSSLLGSADIAGRNSFWPVLSTTSSFGQCRRVRSS
jgi:hypothetical protein